MRRSLTYLSTASDLPCLREGKYILSHGWSFDPESTTVLNFACGTGTAILSSSSIIWLFHENILIGLLETTLIAHCKSIQGVDISQGMVDQYNKRAETLGVTSKMSAIAYELKGLPEELEGRKFDVVLVRTSTRALKLGFRTDMYSQCTMAYHHFESTDEITRILAYFLKPGGALLVIDFVSWDSVLKIEDLPEKYEAIVPHKRGFSEEAMRKLFEDAGLESFSLNVIPDVNMDGIFGLTDQKLFLAKGVKPF